LFDIWIFFILDNNKTFYKKIKNLNLFIQTEYLKNVKYNQFKFNTFKCLENYEITVQKLKKKSYQFICRVK